MAKWQIYYKTQQKAENKGSVITAKDDREADIEAHSRMRSRADAQKIWVKKISETMSRDELKSIIKETVNNNIVITEGAAPDKSIYGAVGNAAMPDLLRIMKKTVPGKYITFGKTSSAGLGLWLIEFKGYSRSDMAINGYVSLTAPGGAIKSWSADIEFTDAMKGKVADSYSFMPHEDWTSVFTSAAKRLKQWVEM